MPWRRTEMAVSPASMVSARLCCPPRAAAMPVRHGPLRAPLVRSEAAAVAVPCPGAAAPATGGGTAALTLSARCLRAHVCRRDEQRRRRRWASVSEAATSGLQRRYPPSSSQGYPVSPRPPATTPKGTGGGRASPPGEKASTPCTALRRCCREAASRAAGERAPMACPCSPGRGESRAPAAVACESEQRPCGNPGTK